MLALDGARYSGSGTLVRQAVAFAALTRQVLHPGSGATLDRYAADQIIPFAALAAGASRFRIPSLIDHIQSHAWLAKEFLGAEISTHGQVLSVTGVGFRTKRG